MAKLLNKEQHDFLVANIKGTYAKDLAKMLNEKFGLNLTATQIKAYKHNHKLAGLSGITGRFEKGRIPANKGKKFPGQTNRTSFKKGNIPANKKEIGAVRYDRDNYLLIKIGNYGTQRKSWRPLHIVVWEKEHGPVPKGHCVIFKNQNKEDIRLDNLELVSFREHLRMNRYKRYTKDKKLTEANLMISKIENKINDLKEGK